MNSSNGDWRDFIEDFNKYEEKHFDSCINSSEISWWHLVRYKVITEILIKKKLYIPIENISVKNSLKSKFKNISKILFEILIIITSRNTKIESLYFFTRNVEYFDNLISSEKKTALIISREMKDYGNNIFISYRTIAVLEKLIKSFVFISKNLKEKIYETSKEIISRYNTMSYLNKDKYLISTFICLEDNFIKFKLNKVFSCQMIVIFRFTWQKLDQTKCNMVTQVQQIICIPYLKIQFINLPKSLL